MSLSNTKQKLEKRGVERSRTAIHDWVHKADVEPDPGVAPTRIALDESVVQVNGERHWLHAAVDPDSNKFLHVRLFHTRTTQLTLEFLRELREKIDLESATFLVDDAVTLTTALARLGLRFRVQRHGPRNAIERVFRE